MAVYSIWNEIIAGVNDPHFARGDEKEKEKEGFHRRNETSGQTLRYSFLIIVRVVTDSYGSMEHLVAIRYFQFAEYSVRYICSSIASFLVPSKEDYHDHRSATGLCAWRNAADAHR